MVFGVKLNAQRSLNLFIYENGIKKKNFSEKNLLISPFNFLDSRCRKWFRKCFD